MIYVANGVASANPVHHESQIIRSAAWPAPPTEGAGEERNQLAREPLKDITREVYPPDEEEHNGAGAATADARPAQEGNMQSPPDGDVEIPSLFEYQYRRVNEMYSRALTEQRAEGQFNEQVDGGRNANPPAAGPSRAPAAGPAQAFGGINNTPLGSSNLETIRANMAKLLEDRPISDEDFARMHYDDGAETARIQQAMRDHYKSKHPSSAPKPPVPQHTQQQFLDQRAASSSHAMRMGETPPSYASKGPEPAKKKEKKKSPGEVAAKAMQDLDKSNKDFERNLRRNFGGF